MGRRIGGVREVSTACSLLGFAALSANLRTRRGRVVEEILKLEGAERCPVQFEE
ncbi:hypothetical protein ACIGKL_14220 [Pseudomonas sp. NPDC077186]|uniref:hypothetical protein n=1 Tax=Pseudomonas sp. NPDC077186 TaxID=3364421 RepID=UPI0037C89148